MVSLSYHIPGPSHHAMSPEQSSCRRARIPYDGLYLICSYLTGGPTWTQTDRFLSSAARQQSKYAIRYDKLNLASVPRSTPTASPAPSPQSSSSARAWAKAEDICATGELMQVGPGTCSPGPPVHGCWLADCRTRTGYKEVEESSATRKYDESHMRHSTIATGVQTRLRRHC